MRRNADAYTYANLRIAGSNCREGYPDKDYKGL